MAEIELYTEDYEKCKVELLAIRNANRETARGEPYLTWRYETRPSTLKPIIVFASNSRGERIGSLSIVAHEYAVDGERCPLGILGDISVDKNWRGKGVAGNMFNYVVGLQAFQSLPAVIVLPNENAASPLSKCGWNTVTRLRRYVRILKVGRKPSLAMVPYMTGSVLQATAALGAKRDRHAYTWDLADHFDARFDRIWRKADLGGQILGARDQRHLTWRFEKYPTEAFRTYVLYKHSVPVGYIVFHFRGNRCHVDDLLCNSEDSRYSDLLLCFLEYLRTDTSTASVSIMINERHRIRKTLLGLGFLKRPDYLRFMVKTGQLGSNTNLLTNSLAWFLTAGDKDA